MGRKKEMKFTSPGFFKRMRGMLGMDFYRLFHTPLFYCFLVITALIPPAVFLSGAGGAGFTNAWQILAADSPRYLAGSVGAYANMNLVFLLGGIMIPVFIGQDYGSGYVKQLFITHARKRDYMMSKTIAGACSMLCMCLAFLAGGLVTALVSGLPLSVNPVSLACAVLGKMLLCLGWAGLYTFISVIFRRKFGFSIALCCFFGAGIPVIGAAALVPDTGFLNLFLYGAAVNACLTSNLRTLLVCLCISAAWAVLYNIIGSVVLSRRDVY